MFLGSIEILPSGPGTLAGGGSGPGYGGGVRWIDSSIVGDAGGGLYEVPAGRQHPSCELHHS